MIFMSPEGGEGRGTATLEAPAAADAPMGPVGQAYTDALTKARGETPPDRTPPASGPTGPASTGPAATGPASTGAAASGATGPAKPATALDAVLGDTPASGATGATGPAAPEVNEFLKELPETLPREGRGAHWEKARGAIATQSKTISELTKANAEKDRLLAEAKAAPAASPVEMEALKKENAELRDNLVAINVDFSTEHRAKFVDGRKAIVSKAAAKLEAFGGQGSLITKAMAMDEGSGRTQAIKTALEGLEPVEQNRILQFVGEIEKLDDEKAEIMKDPQGAWAKLQASEKAKADAAVAKAEENKARIFETVSKALPDKYFLLRRVDPTLTGATEHNAAVDAMQAEAFKLLGADAKPEDLVEAVYAKQMLPRLQTFLIEARTELKAALATLQEYEESSPGYRGKTPPAKTPEEARLDKTPGQLWTESLAKSRGQ